jgi:excisionase family DNA binding protein
MLSSLHHTRLTKEGTMARLHIQFKNIHAGARKAAKTLFDSKPWSGTDEEKQTKFERFLREASEVYGLPTPTLTVSTALDNQGLVAPNTICMDKYSVTTLFHSFRAHMQYTGAVDTPFYTPRDAQAWACSLFYTCRPILFRKQVRARRIAGVLPDDLLTSATLAARQDEVDEAFAGIVAESYDDQEIEDDDADGLDDALEQVSAPTDEQVEDAHVPAERLSITDAAQRLGVSASTVRNRIAAGDLAATRDGRRVWVLLDPSA